MEKLAVLGRKRYVEEELDVLKNAAMKDPQQYWLFTAVMSESMLFSADYFKHIQKVFFNGHMLSLSSYDMEAIYQNYGESWMRIPSDVSKPKHTMLLDRNHSYTSYIYQFSQSDQFEKDRTNAINRRQIIISERKDYRDVLNNRLKLSNLITVMQMERHQEDLQYTDDWKHIYDFFQPYYTTQLKKRNRFYLFILDLDRNLFKKAMEAAIIMNRYDIVIEIMDLRGKSGIAADPIEDKFYKNALLCKEISNAMYYTHDTKVLKELLHEAEETGIRDSLTYTLASIYIGILDSCQDENLLETEKEIERSLNCFGDIGELYILKGDCLAKLGKTEESDLAYEKAAQNLSNAIALQQLIDGGHYTL